MVVFSICVSAVAVVIAIPSLLRVLAKVTVTIAVALWRVKAGDLVVVWWSVGARLTTAA
jgi:hypothetical protein